MVIFSLSHSQERKFRGFKKFAPDQVDVSGGTRVPSSDSSHCKHCPVWMFWAGAPCNTVTRLGSREVVGVPCGICTGALGQLSSLFLSHPHCWPALLTGRGKELGHNLGHPEEGRTKSVLVSVFRASAQHLNRSLSTGKKKGASRGDGVGTIISNCTCSFSFIANKWMDPRDPQTVGTFLYTHRNSLVACFCELSRNTNK